MNGVIGIRGETIDRTERRAPLTPAQVLKLVDEYGLRVLVAPSDQRVFPDVDYEAAGAEITPDLSPSNIIFGVKEIPVERLREDGVYCYFSHTVKAQRYNMPMLKRIIDVGATLLDYELVTNEIGKRLIFFGDYAGYAGMIDTLWALGRRLDTEGIANPFSDLRQAGDYASLSDAETAVVEAGRRIQTEGLPAEIAPLICLFTGRGKVSQGAQKVFGRLPAVRIAPDDIPSLATSDAHSKHVVYAAQLTKPHLYAPRDPSARFDTDEFDAHPERYAGRLASLIDHATLLVNGIFWSPRYPRLLTREWAQRRYARDPRPRLRVIGDITCDIGGSIEFTLKSTTSENPVFVYEPARDRIVDGIEGDGPVVLAVDKLPSELPREATLSFGEGLMPFIPSLADANFRRPFDELTIPVQFKRAVIAHRGRLTEHFRYLNNYLIDDE